MLHIKAQNLTANTKIIILMKKINLMKQM